jgi:hypothetical protein
VLKYLFALLKLFQWFLGIGVCALGVADSVEEPEGSKLERTTRRLEAVRRRHVEWAYVSCLKHP